MKRADKLTTAAGVAACAVCCAPLVLGPLAALGGLVTAGAGAAGVTGAASHNAPSWLLVVLGVVTVSAAIGVAYTVAVIIRRSPVAERIAAPSALLPVTDVTRPQR